ncbi:hypothetical protein ACF0H5_004579 [Mactra antiquata]
MVNFKEFCAWEENLPVDSSAEEAERRIYVEYTSKLKACGYVIPDPCSFSKKQWIGKESGRVLWPPVYISDLLYI